MLGLKRRTVAETLGLGGGGEAMNNLQRASTLLSLGLWR